MDKLDRHQGADREGNPQCYERVAAENVHSLQTKDKRGGLRRVLLWKWVSFAAKFKEYILPTFSGEVYM